MHRYWPAAHSRYGEEQVGASAVDSGLAAPCRHWLIRQVLSVKGVVEQGEGGHEYWPTGQPELLVHGGAILHMAVQ